MASRFATSLASTLFAGLALLGSAQAQTAFTPYHNNSTNGLAILAHGDFTGDGREDFIVATQPPNVPNAPYTCQLYASAADGTYTVKPVNFLQCPSAYSGIVVGDFNHDGKLDVAELTNVNGVDQITAYLGNGDGTFQAAKNTNISYPNNAYYGLAAGDLNHDGKTDLAVTVSANGITGVQGWISNGDGTFKASATYDQQPQSTIDPRYSSIW
ncbi:MAG: VCBS repeat-containing protein, partial [Acidobacteriales bacterium]|nr:VCBS repeat-containing protein [Terriglobales bacterium]